MVGFEWEVSKAFIFILAVNHFNNSNHFWFITWVGLSFVCQVWCKPPKPLQLLNLQLNLLKIQKIFYFVVCLLHQGQRIIISSAYEYCGKCFLQTGSRHLSADNSCKADAHSSVSLRTLTSSFGYNYLPHSGVLSAFVNGTPTLPEEINLSHFLLGFFFFSSHSWSNPRSSCGGSQRRVSLLPGVPFVFTVAHLLAYLCEWSLRW